MTQNEKLDKILKGLAGYTFENETTCRSNFGHFIKDICDILKIELEKGEEILLQGKLLIDGYIEYTNPEVELLIRISNKGLDFISTGGYKKIEEEELLKHEKEELEKKLLKSNITTNKWTRIGIVVTILVSAIALIISVIALLR
jgi:hypothetical protein